MPYLLSRFFAWFFILQPKQPKVRSARFELFRDKAGEYRFRLKAPNHEIILVSEGYTTRVSAKKAITAVKRFASHDKRYQRKKTKNGEYMFNLRSANHEVIGISETYTTTASRNKGITLVKQYAPCAKVVKTI